MSVVMRPLARGALLVAALFALALPAAAQAESAGFVGASADGSHVFIRTEAQLVAEDTDDAVDIYERVGRTTRLVAVGPNFDGGAAAEIQQVSRDGSLVVFKTAVPLIAEDPDGAEDCYARLNAAVTARLSICPTRISETGNRLIYITRQPFTFFDVDGVTDVYVQEVGQPLPVLATPGTTREVGDARVSDSAEAVVFASDEALSPGAAPGIFSVYRTVAGSGFYELISGGQALATLRDISSDVSSVLFKTFDLSGPADPDDPFDLYLRGPAGVTRIKTGLSGRASLVSPSGDVVLFNSDFQLAGIDNDGGGDLYLFENGTYTLVGGELAGDGGKEVRLEGVSNDLRTVAFSTVDALVPGDRDRNSDVYRWSAGSFQLITQGPFATPDARFDFQGISFDGRRAYFSTDDRFLASDRDDSLDVYQRLEGDLRLISSDAAAEDPPVPARFKGFARSRDLTFFQTAQGLLPDDRDNEGDVYARRGKQLLLVSPDSPEPPAAFGAVGTPPGRPGTIVYSCARRCDGDPPGVYSIRPSGGGQRRLVDDDSARDPAFSSDGRSVAYSRARGDISVMRANGAAARPVTAGDAQDSQPGWLPDGRIAFASNRDGDFDIWAIRPNGSGLENLAESIGAASPGGERIVETRCVPGTTCSLFLTDREGKGIRAYQSSPEFSDFDAEFSPDGRSIVFTRVSPDRDSRPRLMIMRPNGAGLRVLVRSRTAGAFDPSFSPDGRSILFNLGEALVTRPLAGGPIRVLVEENATNSDWGSR